MANFTKIDADDLKFGDVVSYEVGTALKENIDLLSLVVPVGEVVPIMVGMPGIPTPDSNMWQECDGSEITNENSPLRTVGDQVHNVPDLREKYIQVPQIFGESGQVGGYNDNYIFRHNHAGVTAAHLAPQDADASNSQHRVDTLHSHTIDWAFDYAYNVEPPFYTMKWFMRIQ